MSAISDRPMTEREAVRAYRKVWERAGCSASVCSNLETIAKDYAAAMGITVETGLDRVTEILHRQLRIQLDDKVCSILEPHR